MEVFGRIFTDNKNKVDLAYINKDIIFNLYAKIKNIELLLHVS